MMNSISKFLIAILVLAFVFMGVSPNSCDNDKVENVSSVLNPAETAWSSTLQVFYINPDMSPQGAGSGTYMVLDGRPYILTAAHVVNGVPRSYIMRACYVDIGAPPGHVSELCTEINRYEGQGARIDLALDLALMPLFGFSSAVPAELAVDYNWRLGEPVYLGACPISIRVINSGVITGPETNLRLFTNADGWWGSSGGGVYNDNGLLIGVMIQLQGWPVTSDPTFGPFRHVVEGNKIFTLIPLTFLTSTPL